MIAALLAAAALAQAPAALALPSAPTQAAAPDLHGRTEAQVRAALGEPAVARKEAAGAMWTYRADACALFVFFTPAEGGALQVSSVSAGPRRRGQPNPDPAACLAAASKG